jgi:Zn-dependent protease with chaperone function
LSEPRRIDGQWQDGVTSRARPAQLTVEGGQARVTVDGQVALVVPLSALSISPRLGSTPRYLRIAGRGGRLETAHGEATAWLDRRIGRPQHRALSRLENHSALALTATAVFLALVLAYFHWGIPAISQLAADRLPASVLDRASRETLQLLDSHYLAPSTLPGERQAELRRLLARHAPDYPIERLRFAASELLGANALALPDGSIVVTDDLVDLAASDSEVLAVLAHELGHVEQRHAIRQLLQGAAIGVTIALVGGDVSTLGDIVLTLPVVFTRLHYSRNFELEADAYARDFLRERGLDARALNAMLTRLHTSRVECEPEQDPCAGGGWAGYFSTHPHLEERLQVVSGD